MSKLNLFLMVSCLCAVMMNGCKPHTKNPIPPELPPAQTQPEETPPTRSTPPESLTPTNPEESEETSTDAATQSTTDATTQSTTDTATQSTTDASTQSTTDASTQSTTDASTQSTTDTATQSTTDTATQSTTDTATQSTTDASTQSTTDASTQSTTDTATQSTTDTATQSTTDASTQSTTDASTQSTTDTATQSTTDASTQSTTDTATQSTTDTATQSTTDASTQSTTDTATQSTTDAATQTNRPRVHPEDNLIERAESHQPHVLRQRYHTKSNSPNERYITRWANHAGATLKVEINDMQGAGKIWLVGAQAVRPRASIAINPQLYGKKSANIPFNWLNDTVGFWPIYFDINQPMPLIAPMKESLINLFPNDPAVVYDNERRSRNINLYYDYMLANPTNRNGAGALNRASAWQHLGFHAGDEVEIVIYIYSTQESYQWYRDSVGLSPTTGIPKTLKRVHLDEVIELERIPVTLE